MLPDPPCPKGGRCVVCGKPRKPQRSRKYAGGRAESDPFCSTVCCREWHGTQLRPTGREHLYLESPTLA